MAETKNTDCWRQANNTGMQVWFLFFFNRYRFYGMWSIYFSAQIFRDLERRIVEAEMELTLAKSQGYLKNRLKQNGSGSGKKYLAVIGLYTGFGSRLARNSFRGSWMPKGESVPYSVVDLWNYCISEEHKRDLWFFSS